MAPRTNATLLAEIIELDSTINVTSKISTANFLYNKVVGDSTHETDHAEMIERWLAAHFYAIHDVRVVSESIEGLSETRSNPVKTGLNATTYGQQAIALDTSGKLAAYAKYQEKGGIPPGTAIGISWLGRTEREQVNAADGGV